MPSTSNMPELSSTATSSPSKKIQSVMEFLITPESAHACDVTLVLQRSQKPMTPLSDSDSESDCEGEASTTPGPAVTLHAHRHALMQHSTFFRAALCSCDEISHVVLPVFNVSLSVMMAVLEHCYLGNIDVNSIKSCGDLIELAAAADKFGMPDLKQTVLSYSKSAFSEDAAAMELVH